jgi:hypothetical protein
MSVPDPRDGQRIDHHHDETEERAAAHRRSEAHDEAEDGTDHDGANFVLTLQDEACLARLHPSLDERLGNEAGGASTRAAPIA